jgi:beta-glucosidase
MKWREVVQKPEKLEAFVAGLPLWELCRLAVCGGMRLLPWQDGAAGYTNPIRRRGLGSFTVSDANAGLNLRKPNVGFPASSMVAATFDREIARREGEVLAEACREHGVAVLLGPGMNLHRSILCGRHPEYFSEDPLLTGEMAGWQGRALEAGGVGCCYKHLFCNNSELGRKGSHSVVSGQALRELYFRTFEIAFRVQPPSAVMTSYNALNGLYPGENPALLKGLLRGEWGFRGAIMSDWGSYDTVDAVQMLKVGNDWITPGGPIWAWRIWKAARRGELPRAALEEDVRYLLKGFARL